MIKKLMYTQRLFSNIIIGLLVCTTTSCSNKGKEFKTIFGQKYIEAENYINSNKWIHDSLARFGVNPSLAISVIFPELIRYSALKDKVETRSLEVLYTQYGSKYADFSIGKFQMKPSFAYQLEKDWNLLCKNAPNKSPIKPFNLNDNPISRMDRILRLKAERWQIKYLVMFLKIVEEKYKVNQHDPEREIHFIASAYNSGYSKDSITIAKVGKLNFFHIGILKPKKCFNYSEISVYYYKKDCRK